MDVDDPLQQIETTVNNVFVKIITTSRVIHMGEFFRAVTPNSGRRSDTGDKLEGKMRYFYIIVTRGTCAVDK